MTILRDVPPHRNEIWCRVDHGPHGYLAIAAHAHADALSIEVRHGGVEVLVDPGTYCYQSERPFREYFRSTAGHNTIEVDGLSQATSRGPFIWTDIPHSHVLSSSGLDGGQFAALEVSHDGYARLDAPVSHARSVTLDRASRQLRVVDRLETVGSGHEVRLYFHLGPSVRCELSGDRTASLSWGDDLSGHASLLLPGEPTWQVVSGATDPVTGWYSPGFGQKQPITTLVGTLRISSSVALVTELRFTREGSPLFEVSTARRTVQ